MRDEHEERHDRGVVSTAVDDPAGAGIDERSPDEAPVDGAEPEARHSAEPETSEGVEPAVYDRTEPGAHDEGATVDGRDGAPGDRAPDEVARGQAAVDSPVDAFAGGAGESQLRPGGVPGQLPAALWDPETAAGLRERWREVQLRFVDDPHSVTAQAAQLATEVLDSFAEVLAARKADIDASGVPERADTEQLRVTVYRYRELIDRLLDL